jgi:2'-5' RNA ligase
VSAKNNEYIYLAFLTEPRRVGEATKRSPQHLTLVPPFPNDVPVLEIKKAVHDVAAQTAPFDIKISGEAKFGPQQNIDVRLVEPADVIRMLHSLLMYKLEAIGVSLPAKYVHKDYVPHISVKPTHANQLSPEEVFTLDHVAIMHKDSGRRTLLAKEDLGE